MPSAKQRITSTSLRFSWNQSRESERWQLSRTGLIQVGWHEVAAGNLKDNEMVDEIKLAPADVAAGAVSRPLSARRFPSNVTDFLLEGKSSDQLVLLLLEGEHTYSELQSAAYDVAKYLVEAGGRKGDRVILVSENSFFWIASYLGILRAGMVCIPLPVATVSKEIDYILQMTEARFGFLEARFAAANATRFYQTSVAVDCELPGSSALRAVSFDSVRSLSAGSSTTLPVVNADDLAALMFTSGSTGRPRGV